MALSKCDPEPLAMVFLAGMPIGLEFNVNATEFVPKWKISEFEQMGFQ